MLLFNKTERHSHTMPGRKRSGTDGGVSAKKRPRVQSKRTRLQNLLDPDSSEEDEFFAGEAPSQQDDGDMESATSQLVSHSSSSIEPYEDPFGGEAARSFTETRQRTESPTSGGSNGCEDSQGDVSHRLEMTLMSATSSSSASDPLHQYVLESYLEYTGNPSFVCISFYCFSADNGGFVGLHPII